MVTQQPQGTRKPPKHKQWRLRKPILAMTKKRMSFPEGQPQPDGLGGDAYLYEKQVFLSSYLNSGILLPASIYTQVVACRIGRIRQPFKD